MATIVIPCAPDIDIQLVSAVLATDGTPEIILYHRNVRERIFPRYTGEISYEMIKNDIVCNHSVFYAKAFEENKKNILRIIVPTGVFYDIIKTNTHLEDSKVVSLTKSVTFGFPEWVYCIDWYVESSKQEPRERVDADEKRSGDSKTSQEGSKQQRSIPIDPPSREGDTVFWH